MIFYDTIYNSFQIARRTAFPDQHLQTVSAFLHSIFIVHTLMIRCNSRQRISCQFSLFQKRRMSVPDTILKQSQFFMHGNTAIDHGNGVHHLSKSQNSRVIQITLHFSCCQSASIVIYMGCRHTGRHHHIHIGRNILCLLQNIINAVCS